MEIPDGGIVAAVLAALATLASAIGAIFVQLRKIRNAHLVQMAQLRADQYLVDFEELEDLRWWRRLAIGVVNKFLDDYTERSIKPPVDAHAALDYPPDRPRKKSGKRLEP